MNNYRVSGTFRELGTEAFKGVTLWIAFKKYYELKKRILFIFLKPEAQFLEKHHNPMKIIQKILNT